MSEAVSPGGPRVSAAKKRRLAALDQTLGAQQQSRASGAGPANSAKRSKGAAPSRAAQSPARGAHASGGAASGGADVSQELEPIYAPLSVEVATGPLAQALQVPGPASDGGRRIVSQLLEALLATNPRRGVDARATIGLKVAHQAVLLDNPAVPAVRARRRERRLSGQLASKQQQRELGLYRFAGAGVLYEQVLPLHQLWCQYVGALLAGAGARTAGGASAGAAGTPAEAAVLLGADMHGCLLRVAESAEARWRGVEGVVVRDTQQTFVVVTKDSRMVVLPKQTCDFEYGMGRGKVVRLLGRNLAPAPTTGGGGRKRR